MPSFHAFTALRISSFPLSRSPFEPLPRRLLTKRLIHWPCLAAASFLESLCFKREILVCCSLDAHRTLFFFSQFLLYHPGSSPTTALAFSILYSLKRHAMQSVLFIHSFSNYKSVALFYSVGNEISFQHPFSAFSIVAT